MLNARIKSALVSVMLMGVFLVNTGATDADIFAERNVRSNKFSATVMNFFAKSTINNSATSDLYKTVGILPGGYDFSAVKIKRDGNANLKYHFKVVKTNGDETLCNNLNLQILKRDLTTVSSGGLMNSSVDSQITSDNPEDWIFLLSLDQNDSALAGKVCQFDFDFKTYRNNPSEQGGIFAQRTIANMVSSGSW